MDSDEMVGEVELGETEGRKTIIWIYDVRRKSIFNKRKNLF